MQLLQDTFIIEQLQVINEGKADGPLKIRGVFGRCNEKNNNGRIYPTAVLESQLKKVQPLIAERRLCGELDHPQNDTVKLGNASHLITKLDMKGNELIGEAEILKTPAGLTAKALVEGGVKIGISSRGMGTLSEDHNGDKIVNEDFRLVTFDLVADPSTRGAFPGLSESTESKFVRESQSKLKKESNFVTMLESKMRDAYQPWVEEAKTKAKKKKAKKNLPGDQENIDTDGDGKIEASDLEKLRKGHDDFEEAFELVKADGIWHRFAEALLGIDEAFADELEKGSATKLAATAADKDTGSMLGNFRAKRHAKGMQVAKAKGAAKGAKHLAKGDVRAARIRQKATDAAAAGGPVTGGERVAAGVRSAAGTAATLARGAAALPGKAISGAERVTAAIKDRRQQKKLASAERGSARERIAARAAAKRPGNAPTPAPQQTKKPGIGDEEKHQRKVLGQAELKKDTADVADRAQAGAEGKFGAGVGREDKGAQRKAIARREKKTGKKVNLTPQQQIDLSHTSYKQLGLMLAEMLDLV